VNDARHSGNNDGVRGRLGEGGSQQIEVGCRRKGVLRVENYRLRAEGLVISFIQDYPDPFYMVNQSRFFNPVENNKVKLIGKK
jgi:hypothetical protein